MTNQPQLITSYPMTTAADSLGQMFAQAREAKGLSQSEVASRLMLDTALVAAIENSELETLGAPVFAKGYLLRYARLLGLSEALVLERFRQFNLPEPPPLRVNHAVKPQLRSADLRWLVYLVGLIVLAWLVWQGYEAATRYFGAGQALPLIGATAENTNDPTSLPLPLRSGDTASTTPATATTPATSTAAEASAPPVSTTVAPPSTGGTTQPLALPPPSAVATTASETPAATEPAPVDDGLVAIEVKAVGGNSSVEVKDATGTKLIARRLKADETSSVRGKLPFTISLGNSRVINIMINGKPVPEDQFRAKRQVRNLQLEEPQDANAASGD